MNLKLLQPISKVNFEPKLLAANQAGLIAHLQVKNRGVRLLNSIRDYFEDPEVQAEFEVWQKERAK